MPAWGPYSRLHIGPACLVNRLLLQQFAFPVVISQQREETMVQTTRTPDGKTRVHQDVVTLLRRTSGLSPAQADDDDLPVPASAAHTNRRAHLTEADRDGLLWHATVSFAPADVTQKVAQLPDASGKPVPAAMWGAADATVDYFPAYGDTSGDGLLVRVALTNRSDARQTYCVDLLGGLDAEAEDFPGKDLEMLPDTQGEGIAIRHPKCTAAFALSANPAPMPVRAYRVDASYFAATANIAARDANGDLLPSGLLHQSPDNRPATPQNDINTPKPNTQHPTPDLSWGLVRLAGIPVAPGETVTLFFSVGVGKDVEAARDSAQTLLGIAEDAMPGGKLREGAYTLAQRKHHDTVFAAADPGISGLMAQALANVPLLNGRRIGVPSRQAVHGKTAAGYEVAQGGMIALAYAQINPDYAAAQLNTWFQSRGDPDASPPNPVPFPPTNLLALWDLLQSVRDRDLLARLYPFARRRHLELVAGGGRTASGWLCGWPAGAPADLFIPSLVGDSTQDSKQSGSATPDYVAYVICSARLLRALAVQAGRPAAEIQSYTDDIEQAGKVLNERLWHAERGLYAPDNPLNPDTVADLLPLIAGSATLPPERRAGLLKALTDPAQFWSPAGIRQVSKASATYQPASPLQGAIHAGINWLLWRGLLDLGETETANRLAANLLSGYHAAQTTVDGCPEWLDGNTGAPGGVNDYSGDMCALIPIYAAYHIPGAVSSGWNLQMLDRRYDAKDGSLHLAFRNLEPTQASTLICALGVPNGRYKLTGSLSGEVAADANGVIVLHSPTDGTTQAIDVIPAHGNAQ